MGRSGWSLACVLWLAAGAFVHAQETDATRPLDTDAARPVKVILKDGTSFVGTIVAEEPATVTLRTAAGAELKVPREAIVSRAPAGDEPSVPPAAPTAPSPAAPAAAPPSPSATPAPLSDPNESRLMFAPTGRPLGKGNGYFSDHYVLFPGFAYGLTENVSIAGGISAIPAVGLSDQVFYVTLSSGWKLGDKAALAVGGAFAGGAADEGDGFAVGTLFGVATFGPSDRSLSIGLATIAVRNEEYYYSPGGDYRTETKWSFRDAPVVMLGGSLRVARHLSLIGEGWLFPGSDFELSQQPFGLALRFFNGRISADVGVVLVAEVLEEGFPIPWLSFSYHFGPSRRAESRHRRPATPAWARMDPLGRR